MFVSLFQIRRQHIFDPFHECANSARQIAPMCYDGSFDAAHLATMLRYRTQAFLKPWHNKV